MSREQNDSHVHTYIWAHIFWYALADAASSTGGRQNARVLVVPVRVLFPPIAALTAWRESTFLL